MSEVPTMTQKSVWTKKDMQKLLHAMKHSIPKSCVQDTYTKGQRTLDWKKVAFHPHSPEDCKQKWAEISQKIRKIRTLTELIVEAESAIDNPLKGSRIHPAFPKRPTPANAIFYQEKLAKFQKQHPDLKQQELFKLVSKKYKELPEHKKAKYVEKFQVAQEEYMQSMQQFRKRYKKTRYPDQLCLKNGESPPKRRRLRSSDETEELQSSPDKEQHSDEEDEEERRIEETQFKPRGDPPDKPPINAYNLFCKEQWASSEGVSNKGFISVCAQRWKQLSQKEKDNYKTHHNQLKDEYQVKLREYLCDYDEKEQQQILNQYGIRTPLKNSTRKCIRTFPGEPPMPSRSSYAVFCSKQMKLMKSKIPKSRERMARVQRLWQELSEEEKDNYKEEADNNFRRYSAELQRWFETLTAEEQAAYKKQNKTKCQYLQTKEKTTTYAEEGASKYRPSDSEDEDLEVSSNEEQEEEDWNSKNDGEEEEEDEISWM